MMIGLEQPPGFFAMTEWLATHWVAFHLLVGRTVATLWSCGLMDRKSTGKLDLRSGRPIRVGVDAVGAQPFRAG